MKKYMFLAGVIAFFSCKNAQNEVKEKGFTHVKIQNIVIDSISVRAIEIKDDYLFYAGNKGKFGYINLENPQDKIQHQVIHDSIYPEFRSVASTAESDFILSVGNPALLYEVNPSGDVSLRYQEIDADVFYDSMTFWNAEEGIAMGDPTSDCLSIIITRDGGKSWEKVDCSNLPKAAEGEAAFAASDTNIEVVGNKTWLISGGIKSRVYYSPDKGKTWSIQEIPLVKGGATTGGYSIDFYNEKIGVIIGGDYTKMQNNQCNKAITFNGGKTWKLMAEGENPGYKSSIQFVPKREGKEIVAVGPTGISYSCNAGKTWKEISNEGFYTFRFLNDSVAYAAGHHRISRLVFN